jgi:hypothetical protein
MPSANSGIKWDSYDSTYWKSRAEAAEAEVVKMRAYVKAAETAMCAVAWIGKAIQDEEASRG